MAQMFAGKGAPEWIEKHVSTQKPAKKVFPSFGLKNFKEPADIKVDDIFLNPLEIPYINNALTGIVRRLQSVVDFELYEALATFKQFEYKKIDEEIQKETDLKLGTEGYYKEFQRRKEEKKINTIVKYIDQIQDFIREYKPYILTEKSVQKMEDGTIKLLCSNNFSGIIFDKKISFFKGESLFKIYGKLKSKIDELFKLFKLPSKTRELDSLPEIKEFNKNNIPIKKDNLFIVFSSSGEEGAWDIATMSERGIRSCQSWEPHLGVGEYRPCLIGSIASRYIGIIYLTSGKEIPGRGTKMIKRCVVRFGINTNKSEEERGPAIILDKMYDSYSETIAKAFKNSLQKRTNIPIIDFSSGTVTPDLINYIQNIQIPKEKIPGITDYMRFEGEDVPIGYGFKGYQDTKFEYLEKKEKLEKTQNKAYNLYFNKDYIEELIIKIQDIIDHIYYKYDFLESDINYLKEHILPKIDKLYKLLTTTKRGKNILSERTKDSLKPLIFNQVKKILLDNKLKLITNTDPIRPDLSKIIDVFIEELEKNKLMF